MKQYSTVGLRLLEQDRILEVRLNRPEVRNAFNEVLIQELFEVFTALHGERAATWKQVRAVLFRGEGKAFCGGGDLNWMKASLSMSEAENFADCQRLTRMFLAMDRCPVPIVGIVHGFAIGGGVGLTAVCDHVLAADDTIFSLSEVKLGLVPACIGPFVLSKVGLSQCRSLFVSGERFSAEKAARIGLVHEVLPSADLENRALQVAKQIMEGGPYAVSVAKHLLSVLYWDLRNDSMEKSLDFAANELAKLRVGAEGQEGLKAFLEKRSPKWRS